MMDSVRVAYMLMDFFQPTEITALPPSQEEGAPGERCAPIGGYDDIVVVRAVKLGGVASGDRMEPSAVATNTQQATYATPNQTKKASDITMVTRVHSEGWGLPLAIIKQ